MSHPHNEHRAHKVEKERVHRLCGGKGYASGGAVKEKVEVADKALAAHRKEHEVLKAKGGKPKHRMDKPHRAKGGRVKHKHSGKTNVNVIVAPKSDAPGGAPMAGVAPPHPPMAAAPPPAAAIPPAPAPAMAKPPMPPMAPGAGAMPMRKRGGAVEAGRGQAPGAKTDSLAGPSTDQKGTKSGAEKAAHGEKTAVQRKRGGKVDCSQGMTPVQHTDNKDDSQNIGRKKPITYAKGGKVDPIKKGGEEMYGWAQHNEAHEGGGPKANNGRKQYAAGWKEHEGPTLARAKHQRATGGPIYADGREGVGMGPNLHAGANSGLGRLRKEKAEAKYNRV